MFIHVNDLLFMNLVLLSCWNINMIELVSFADSVTRRTPCLIASLNTQDTDLWDFFLERELTVTEEKVCCSLWYVPTYDAFFMSFYLWKVIGEYFVPVIFVLNGSYCLFSYERAFLIYWLDYLLQLEMNFDFLRSFF